MNEFDIIVIGAGHAGIEACLASSKKGMKTLMITQSLEKVGFMSCNPSIGGLAKGHMVRELDVLGGEMGRAADTTCIQFKRLNARKGPAVRGSRSQNDKEKYALYMKQRLTLQENLTLKQGEVKTLLIKNHQCRGVVVKDGSEIHAKAVVITAGTFMNGVIHVGDRSINEGRVGEKASTGLSDQIRENGFSVQRLKTGTPPRLHRDSIDWDKTEAQNGDKEFYPFSFRSSRKLQLPQIQCFLTMTNEKTHEIIRSNLKRSPLYGALIDGVGPRYCPSIEDKIVRFYEKTTHQTFLEPEGLNSKSIYLQGISTSLPEEIQYQFLRTIPGLENVKMIQPGYVVEYDFIEPTQILHTLETRTVQSLFLAGQVNGSSGYEEAAAQGFIAGINAAQKVLNEKEFILSRDEAYIGVLIDDLVTKGTKEPYRMFTSRAEHRLVLREDNTLDRLNEKGFSQGVLDKKTHGEVTAYLLEKKEYFDKLEKTQVCPSREIQRKLEGLNSPTLSKPISLKSLIRRNEISCAHAPLFAEGFEIPSLFHDPLEIEIKYEGYIKRQLEIIKQLEKLEKMKIPADLNYANIHGLSNEEVEKLGIVKPRTIAQVQRISGVNPSAVQAILVHLKGHRKTNERPE